MDKRKLEIILVDQQEELDAKRFGNYDYICDSDNDASKTSASCAGLQKCNI